VLLSVINYANSNRNVSYVSERTLSTGVEAHLPVSEITIPM